MTSILDVAMAARLTADEIQNGAFDRCYGTFARDAEGCETNPNGPDGEDGGLPVAWCGLGRLCYNLDLANTTDLLHAVRKSPTCIEALWRVQAESWPLWDSKLVHEAAAELRSFAATLERYIARLEARREALRA